MISLEFKYSQILKNSNSEFEYILEFLKSDFCFAKQTRYGLTITSARENKNRAILNLKTNSFNDNFVANFCSVSQKYNCPANLLVETKKYQFVSNRLRKAFCTKKSNVHFLGYGLTTVRGGYTIDLGGFLCFLPRSYAPKKILQKGKLNFFSIYSITLVVVHKARFFLNLVMSKTPRTKKTKKLLKDYFRCAESKKGFLSFRFQKKDTSSLIVDVCRKNIVLHVLKFVYGRSSEPEKFLQVREKIA